MIDEFQEFWSRYPRKVGTGAAKKAYDKALKSARHDDIMAGLSEQLPALESRQKQYIPHASTWLNQERWKDETEQPADVSEHRHADTGDRQINVAARAIRSPSSDCF